MSRHPVYNSIIAENKPINNSYANYEEEKERDIFRYCFQRTIKYPSTQKQYYYNRYFI